MYVQERERAKEREGRGREREGEVERVIWKEPQEAMSKVDPDATPADVCTKERAGEKERSREVGRVIRKRQVDHDATSAKGRMR